jgi:hypothetical protein
MAGIGEQAGEIESRATSEREEAADELDVFTDAEAADPKGSNHLDDFGRECCSGRFVAPEKMVRWDESVSRRTEGRGRERRQRPAAGGERRSDERT